MEPEQLTPDPSPSPNSRWEAKVTAKLTRATADEIWPLYTDFFNFHKWFPTLSVCYGAHGSNGEPSCVRYCQGSSLPSAAAGGHPFTWSKERLLSIDHSSRRLSYEMVDGNVGFRSYVATIRVAPADGGGGGSEIEWAFGVEPVGGLTLEGLVGKYQMGLEITARNMEDSLYGPGPIKD